MKHVHAELMALYAQDAMETDKPWERWEISGLGVDEWVPCNHQPTWSERRQYHRKGPKPQEVEVVFYMSKDGYIHTAVNGTKEQKSYEENGRYTQVTIK